jgi:hypothetical protein
MNGRSARLIRRFAHWAQVRSHSEIRKRKRAWKRLSHKQRGKLRARIEKVMAGSSKVPTVFG